MCHIVIIRTGGIIAQSRLSIQRRQHFLVRISAVSISQDFPHCIRQVCNSSEVTSHSATAAAEGGVDVGVKPDKVHAEDPSHLKTKDDV